MSSPQSRRRQSPWVLLYIAFIVGLGAATLYWLRPDPRSLDWPVVATFAVLIFLAEATPVELPRGRGTVSVSYAVNFACLLVLGPRAATWLAALATVRLVELSGRVPLRAALFNRGQIALSLAAAGLTYIALGGVPGRIDMLHSLGAMAAASAACSLVNLATVAMVMYLSQGGSFWGIWAKDFRWMLPHYLALTPLGILIALVQGDVGLAGLVLFFVPLAVARYSMQLYAEMRKAYLATIQAMVAAIEARDPYTAGHSRRVARYTVAMARALHLSEEQIERLEYAAWLHDVGKIAVPDHILQKREALTPEEWDKMKKHPETGANILRQIKLLGRDIDVVLHHHERWDGEGYPDFMRGRDIPLGARLIAIADAYEAMTSVRPYRARVLTRAEALAELRRCAGSQFDPELVEVFARALDSLPPTGEPGDAGVPSVVLRPVVGPSTPAASAGGAASTEAGTSKEAAGLAEAAASAEAGTLAEAAGSAETPEGTQGVKTGEAGEAGEAGQAGEAEDAEEAGGAAETGRTRQAGETGPAGERAQASERAVPERDGDY